ncbi:folate-binding protein 1 [Typha angustifolia]|uniref:folate-binding protein 1 n=1 Tax=Typha angustifolia TaxID=59011 RepID=UPI003C2B4554
MGCDEAALLLLFLFLLGSPIPASAGQPNGLCVSPGGRFPAFSTEGKPPRRVAKGPRDLTLCRVFRQSTCCDVAQTYPALLSVRRLASSGEGSQECLHLWELLECSICDPRVGVQTGPPKICASFCDMVFQACSNAYYSVDVKTQVLSPCGLSDILCGRAAEWVSNGTELCRLAGFSVELTKTSSEGVDEPFCYGGKANLGSIADSWRTPQAGSAMTLNSGVLNDFQQWLGDMPVSEKVSWAVGGMVLTAGLIFISKRKSYSRRQKQAAVLRTARKLEARVNQKSPSSNR